MKCLNVLCVNPSPFYVIKLDYASKGEILEKKVFHGLKLLTRLMCKVLMMTIQMTQ